MYMYIKEFLTLESEYIYTFIVFCGMSTCHSCMYTKNIFEKRIYNLNK